MSDKDLQRVTASVSDIGQAVSRRAFPARRNHIAQKVRIAGKCTLSLSVNDDESPTEILIRKNIDPLIKSPVEALPQDTQQDQSAAKGEDS